MLDFKPVDVEANPNTPSLPSATDTQNQKGFFQKVGDDARSLLSVPSTIIAHPIKTAEAILNPMTYVDSLKQTVDPQFYKDHPLTATINTLSWLALPFDFWAKGAMTGFVKGATDVAAETAIKGGFAVARDASFEVAANQIPEQVIRQTITKTLSDTLGQAIKTGDTSLIRTNMMEKLSGIKGLAPENVQAIADSAMSHIEQNFEGIASQVKVINPFAHPFKTLVGDPLSVLGKSILGEAPKSAVMRIFGEEAVTKNAETFARVEDFMKRSAQSEGLPTTTDALTSYLKNIINNHPELSGSTAEEFLANWKRFETANPLAGEASDILGETIVPGKSLLPADVEAITRTITRGGGAAGNVKAMVDEITKIYPVLKSKTTELSQLISKNPTADGIANAIKSFQAETLVEDNVINSYPGLRDIADKIKETGYNLSYAPENRDIVRVNLNGAEEIVGNQTTFYRGEGGTNVAQGKALLAEGRNFSMDSEYPKGFGTVKEYVAKPGAKIFKAGNPTFEELSKMLDIPKRSYISPKELSAILKEKGYDILEYNGEYASTGKPFTHIVELTDNSLLPKGVGTPPPPLDLAYHKTFIGTALDKMGLSTKNVGDQLLQGLYQEKFNKFAEGLKAKYGEVIDLGSRSVPVDKLYAQLNVLKSYVGKNSVAQLTAYDLQKFGVEANLAKDIVGMTKKSLDLPIEYTGLGSAVTNWASSHVPGFNQFLNTTMAGHFKYNPLFAARLYIKNNILGAFEGKAITMPQGSALADGINRLIQKIPYAKNLIAPTITDNEALAFSQNIMSKIKTTDIIDIVNSGEVLDWATKAGVQKGTEASNVFSRMLGVSTQLDEINLAKTIAKKYGITLDQLPKYKNISDEIANAVQNTFHYKPGLETSPLIRTLNTISYPIRFETKVAIRTANWLTKLGETHPFIKADVMAQMNQGFDFLQSQEGKDYIKKNKGWLLALNYFLPYSEIGNTVGEITQGKLFNGNAGYIGGLPFGFVVNVAKSLGILPEEKFVDEYTGLPSKTAREVPKQLFSTASAEVALEDLLTHLFPMSLYSLTNGKIFSPVTEYKQGIRAFTGTTKGFKKVQPDYSLINQ